MQKIAILGFIFVLSQNILAAKVNVDPFFKGCSQKIAAGLEKQTSEFVAEKSFNLEPTSIELSNNCSDITVRYLVSYNNAPNKIFSCVQTSADSKLDPWNKSACDLVTNATISVQKGKDFVSNVVQRLSKPEFHKKVAAGLKGSVAQKGTIVLKTMSFDLDKENRALKVDHNYTGALMDDTN